MKLMKPVQQNASTQRSTAHLSEEGTFLGSNACSLMVYRKTHSTANSGFCFFNFYLFS